MAPGLFRGFLLGYLRSIRSTAAKERAGPRRWGCAWLAWRGRARSRGAHGRVKEAKINCNLIRERVSPGPITIRCASAGREEWRPWLERARSAPSTPPACEALRQMPADRETLVSLKRAAEKPRRSTTSTDRDRRASPSSGARCRRASKTISSKSG